MCNCCHCDCEDDDYTPYEYEQPKLPENCPAWVGALYLAAFKTGEWHISEHDSKVPGLPPKRIGMRTTTFGGEWVLTEIKQMLDWRIDIEIPADLYDTEQ